MAEDFEPLHAFILILKPFLLKVAVRHMMGTIVVGTNECDMVAFARYSSTRFFGRNPQHDKKAFLVSRSPYFCSGWVQRPRPRCNMRAALSGLQSYGG